MAKSTRSKRKVAKAKAPKRVTFTAARKALTRAGVPNKTFGQFDEAGTPQVDRDKLEAFKKKMGKRASGVRFVALNAPFKRRSPIAPA
jgi:hypothetical protein